MQMEREIMGYSFQVVYTDPNILRDSGYGKVSDIPCIFDSRPGFHRAGSQFLQERGLGVWKPLKCRKKGRVFLLSAISVKNYANRLANFLEWCDVNGRDPATCPSEIDIIIDYKSDMSGGAWAVKGKRLSVATVNVRADTAMEYFEWLTHKKLRYEEARLVINSELRSGGESAGRAGKSGVTRATPSKRMITFPPQSMLAAWYKRVETRAVRGAVEALIVDLMMETAIRLNEAACFRVDTIPIKIDDWVIANPHVSDELKTVLVEIKYGTKGPDFGIDHGDKIGPVGTIRVPYKLALRLHDYRRTLRLKALSIRVFEGRSAREQIKIRNECVHLFLNPISGRRYTADNIYELWRLADPPKGWSPHRCRDYWACTVLWERLEQQRLLLEKALGTDSVDEIRRAVVMSAETCIQLEIQPQLRHRSSDTTVIYLQWLSDRIGSNVNFQLNWIDEITEG